MSISIELFPDFFRALWDYEPFPWQSELAARLCVGKTPDFVAVPTGSGKSASLDAAIFALAAQALRPPSERTVGRRIFFIVNRRVIVDEAFGRTRDHLVPALRDPEKYVASRESKKPPERRLPSSQTAQSVATLKEVASALRKLTAEDNPAPLACAQLRGGIYLDRSWASSLLQPMIVCSTIDQAGSRLLFRGYGVSPQARPIHAALVSQDSLLLIDEAHISRPFIQTLEWVKRYRLHQPAGCETVRLPFEVIQMTATPPAATRDDQKITLTPKDHEHPVLKPRLRAAKPARLTAEPKAKGKAREEQMSKRLAEEAEKILVEHQPRSIAIMVNRVATARSVAKKLDNEHNGRVTLLIGRLRPLDREAATKQIQERLKTGATLSPPASGPLIVVSTQCLEVGADLDFDALVTEAASLDALRQRFGRLNRGGRDILARAVIVLPGDQDLPAEQLDDAAPCDPIYGNAIPRTWRWLNGLAQGEVVDFGIDAMTAAVDSLRATGTDAALTAMLSPASDAPVLLPAYLDCWVQTNAAPAADPDVALFLHGPQREMTEVQVCWRGDLPEAENPDRWEDILSLCPPASSECLPVPLHILRGWLDSRGKFEDFSGDVAEIQAPPEKKKEDDARGVPAFVWRGPDDRFFVHRGAELRPGDTVVLRVQSGGWAALGHLPDAPADPQTTPDKVLTAEEIRRVDLAELATVSTRRRAVIRIHPALWPTPAGGTAAAALMEMALDQEKDWRNAEIKELLARLLSDENPGWVLGGDEREVVQHLAKSGRLLVEPYPDDEGFVLTSRALLAHRGSETSDAGDTDPDALLEAAQPQELCNHTQRVLDQLERALPVLPFPAWRDALIAAAAVHDWGKVDPRFQAMLRGTIPFAAMASEIFLAKSGSIPSSSAARRAARHRAELPEGFRHEMLSVQMAENSVGATALPANPALRDLALHLVATHHGYARPFAPLVDDDAPPGVSLAMNGKTIAVTTAERLEHPAHALDSGLAERFWQMNRHYGWWGIALLETVIRLADQSASANPQAASRQ